MCLYFYKPILIKVNDIHILNCFLSPLLACVLLFGFLVSGTLQAGIAAAPPPIQVKALNDYLIYFFDGRHPTERYAKEWNWFDDAAMKLGVGTYVIHQGDTAVVYDTFTSVAQAKWVRNYMQKMCVKKLSVVHSYWQ